MRQKFICEMNGVLGYRPLEVKEVPGGVGAEVFDTRQQRVAVPAYRRYLSQRISGGLLRIRHPYPGKGATQLPPFGHALRVEKISAYIVGLEADKQVAHKPGDPD